MENFELIDNLFQIAVLLCACVAAGILAIRHRNRSLLILSLAYACFAMGTIYYVLYLVIIGIWPQVFYVAEISWLAAWLFYLSVQILPGEGKKDRFSLPAGAAAAVIAAIAFLDSRRDHVSLGISHAKRQFVPKKRLVYDHLRYVAGAIISGFRLHP